MVDAWKALIRCDPRADLRRSARHGYRRAPERSRRPRAGAHVQRRDGGLRRADLRQGSRRAPHDRGLARSRYVPPRRPALHPRERVEERARGRPLQGARFRVRAEGGGPCQRLPRQAGGAVGARQLEVRRQGRKPGRASPVGVAFPSAESPSRRASGPSPFASPAMGRRARAASRSAPSRSARDLAACPSWLYPNADEAGYYRFVMDKAQLLALTRSERALSPRIDSGWSPTRGQASGRAESIRARCSTRSRGSTRRPTASSWNSWRAPSRASIRRSWTTPIDRCSSDTWPRAWRAERPRSGGSRGARRTTSAR